MTMKIEVTIPEDEIKNGNSAGYVEKALWALGYGRLAPATRPNAGYAGPDMNEVLPDEGPNYAAMKAAQALSNSSGVVTIETFSFSSARWRWACVIDTT